jgi:hypothetical protein
MAWPQPEKGNLIPHTSVDELIRRHASGDRNPLLLWQLDLLAWAAFHEPPPDISGTPEQADLRFLRSREGYEHLADYELLELIREHPVLLTWERLEAALEEMSRRPGDESER